MTETIYMILMFKAGLLLGIIFFAGLWFTVNKAISAKMPAVWFFTSLILRVGIVVAGFYFISTGGWQRLVISLAGFIVARILVTYFTKSIDRKRAKLGGHHEA